MHEGRVVRTNSKFEWSKNPAFVPYVDGKKERICDDLAVGYLLEVEDADLTDTGLAHKWDAPKFASLPHSYR